MTRLALGAVLLLAGCAPGIYVSEFTYGRLYQGAVERCQRGELKEADCTALKAVGDEIEAAQAARETRARRVLEALPGLLLKLGGMAL